MEHISMKHKTIVLKIRTAYTIKQLENLCKKIIIDQQDFLKFEIKRDFIYSAVPL